jgi:glycosyltransferase involved in cell wall biosynthesis
VKVYAYPADAYGCGHYRMIWPSWQMQAEGVDVEVMVPGDVDAAELTAQMDRNNNVIAATCPADADVLVFQRPSYPQLVKSIPHFIASGIAVVIDVDDDLSHIDPSNPAWTALHPDPKFHTLPAWLQAEIREAAKRAGVPVFSTPHRRGMFDYWKSKRPPHNWQMVKQAAREATLVTVSTPVLAQRYGRGNNAVVIENCIPQAFLTVSRVDSDVIAWAGSVHSHPGDLKAMGGAVGDLVREGGRFMVVGDTTLRDDDDSAARRDLGLNKVERTGPIEFKHWAAAIAQIGVGVAPLQDNRFNEAKSWLKPLEYAAVGVPWVASDRNEYRRLAARGAGRLARKRTDWVKHLRALVRDEQLRAEESEAARAIARTLTIEAHAWRYAEVWQRALDTVRGAKPAATVLT